MAQNKKKVLYKLKKGKFQRQFFADILKSGEFSDISFLTGDENNHRVFKTHRLILMSATPKFQELFSKHEKEELIVLPHIDPDVFEQLLNVIYTNNMELDTKSTEFTAKCLKVFEEFSLPIAVDQCKNHLEHSSRIYARKVSYKSAIDFYEKLYGDDSEEGRKKIEECIKVFGISTNVIIESERFLRAQPETVATIFELPHLKISSELDLLIALYKYAKANDALPRHDLENDTRFKEFVEPALKQIRFLTLNPEILLSCEAFSVMFSDADKLRILSNLTTKPLNDMPEGLSTFKIVRYRYFRNEEKKSFRHVNQVSDENANDIHLKGTVRDENRWLPTVLQTKDDRTQEEKKQDALYRLVRSSLNKLTPSNFGIVCAQLLAEMTDSLSEEELKGCVQLIFEKAISEPIFSTLYAKLCSKLTHIYSISSAQGKKPLTFRVLLLNQLQSEFEKHKDNVVPENDKEEFLIRRRAVGTVIFMGEMYKLIELTFNILSFNRILLNSIGLLLDNGDEFSLECLCELLITVGKHASKNFFDLRDIFKKLKENCSKVCNRIRFLIFDLIELKDENWEPRRFGMIRRIKGRVQLDGTNDYEDTYYEEKKPKVPLENWRNKRNQRNVNSKK